MISALGGERHIGDRRHGVAGVSAIAVDVEFELGAFVSDAEGRVARLERARGVGEVEQRPVRSQPRQRDEKIQPDPVVGLQRAESRLVRSPILVERLDAVATALHDEPGIGTVERAIVAVVFEKETGRAFTGYELK